MINLKMQKPGLKSLGGVRRQAVDLSNQSLVAMSYLQPEQTLPLVIKPAVDDINLVAWAEQNRGFIESELFKHGAILFRGFDVKTALEFEQIALSICPDLFGDYGDLPRELLTAKVYGSTPYPADQVILFHNESSHMHRWPMKILFFCFKAAESGGETPIVDCRKIYQLIHPEIRENFFKRGLMYVRNYTEGLDVSWQDFFKTTSRAVVEDYCRKASIEFTWKPNGVLKTRQVCPAILNHPKTGEFIFFNQVQLHHVSCLDPAVRDSMLAMIDEEDLPRNVYYGDGSPIGDSLVQEICEQYRKSSISFPWQEGDILMLDNMLVAHGRNPYVGQRKIIVAMGEMFTKAAV